MESKEVKKKNKQTSRKKPNKQKSFKDINGEIVY
jgi:hypothetical protein